MGMYVYNPTSRHFYLTNSGLWLLVYRPGEECACAGYPTSRLLSPVHIPEEVCIQVWIQPCIRLVSFFYSFCNYTNICQDSPILFQDPAKIIIHCLADFIVWAVPWATMGVNHSECNSPSYVWLPCLVPCCEDLS